MKVRQKLGHLAYKLRQNATCIDNIRIFQPFLTLKIDFNPK